MIKPAIATPESDALLRKEWRQKGREAHDQGVFRVNCPVASLKTWWLEGWDSCGIFIKGV